ncbi:CaiB/BaiF CoA transferase family protein, partial [Thermodesulfobacteriota bacterium]
KVEKPGGDSANNIPPFYKDLSGTRQSLYWNAFNTGKRCITLNLEAIKGQDLFRILAKNTDFVLESFFPGYLDGFGLGYDALSRLNRGIIVVSITHFGQKGPYRNYRSSELVDSAMSGILSDTGHPDRPPVKEALDSLYFHAGASGALCAIMAHYFRKSSGQGQHIDVSVQEVAVSRAAATIIPWQWDNSLIKRAGVMGQFGTLPIRKVWCCKDGYIFWMLTGGPLGAPTNKAISEWMAENHIDHPLRDMTNWEDLDLATIKQEILDDFHAAISELFMRYTKQEIDTQSQKRGLNAAIVNNAGEVLEKKQCAGRNFWVEFHDSKKMNKIKYPKYYIVSDETDNYIRHPAPVIGQDNEQIYTGELGLSDTEIAELKKSNVI